MLAALNSKAILKAEINGSEHCNRRNDRKLIIKGDIIQLLWCSIENMFRITLPSLLCVTLRALLRNMSVNNVSALHLLSLKRRDYCGKEINGSLLETLHNYETQTISFFFFIVLYLFICSCMSQSCRIQNQDYYSLGFYFNNSLFGIFLWFYWIGPFRQ